MRRLIFVVLGFFLISCNDDATSPKTTPENNRGKVESPEALVNVDIAELEELGFTYLVNNEEARAIRLWASRCRPSFTNELAAMEFAVKEFENGDQLLYRFFPIFGIIESTDVIEESTIGNPRNYDIDLPAIAENHETAPCDIPEDYTIVGYVSALEPLDRN